MPTPSLSSRPSRRRRAVAASLLAMVLLAAGCDDSETTDSEGATDGASGSETTDDTAAADDFDAAAVLGEPAPATGDPVQIGVISSSEAGSQGSAASQRAEGGMNMMVDYANEYLGGIGGRPIELFICQSGDTPAGWQDCANQMVNQGVVAVVEALSGQPSAITILAEAGVPYLTIAGISAEELTTPGVFSMTGGFPATLVAWATHASENDIPKFSLVGIDSPAITQAAQFLGDQVFTEVGVEFEFVPAAFGTPDMTPQLQAAVSGGTGALAVLGDITFCTSFMQAYQTLGLAVPKYLVSLCVEDATVEQFGTSVMEGSSMIGSVTGDTDDPDYDLYRAVAETYGEDEDVEIDPNDDPGAAAGATAMLTFARLVADVGTDVTQASVRTAVETAVDVPLYLGGGATLTCDGTAIPLFAGICSGYMLIGTMDAEGRMTDPQLIDASPLYAG